MAIADERAVETDTEPIQYEVDGHVATIWLNRPHIRNAVNWELLNQMAARVEEAAEDDHVRVALFRGCGPIYRLPRIMGIRKSKELMLTGKLLSGKEAASPEWNLANKSAPAAELDQLVEDFVADLVDKSPFCMKITKETLNRGLDADTESLIVMEQMACNVVHNSADAKEGVAA